MPIAYERLNGTWVCAENFAGTVQALGQPKGSKYQYGKDSGFLYRES